MLVITKALKDHLVASFGLNANASDDAIRKLVTEKYLSGELSADTVKSLMAADDGQKALGGPSLSDITDPAGGNGGGTRVRVKGAGERYSCTKSLGLHRVTGQPVEYEGKKAYTPSELQYAHIGVWFKHFMRSNSRTLVQWGVHVPELNDHEKSLLSELYHEGMFCGPRTQKDWIDGAKLKDVRGLDIKALLNDAGSGGQNLVPFEFDEAVITFPLLNGELFPFIDLRSTVRDQVQTASIGNPTISWGTPEGTSISLFDTSSLIGNVTSDVENACVALEWGKDLESDSPVELGRILIEQIGQQMSRELDVVIANGNGTDRPEGIFQKAGVTAISSDNGNGGPPTVGDLESLYFALPKQYRRPEMNVAFVGNDTTYSRVRGIAVGGSDQRRVMGMDVNSYKVLDQSPYRVAQDLANTSLACVALKKYRMWRRTGQEVFLTDQGRDLALRNMNLLVVRQRIAGVLTDVNAAAKITDLQS